MVKGISSRFLPKVPESVFLSKMCIRDRINVDEEEALARRFGVVSIPTLVFMKNGAAVKKSVGYVDADELRALIDGAL